MVYKVLIMSVVAAAGLQAQNYYAEIGGSNHPTLTIYETFTSNCGGSVSLTRADPRCPRNRDIRPFTAVPGNYVP